MDSPLAIDLFCGLGGWTEGLLAEGYYVVGFDVERHEYGDHKYPGQLVLQDVLTLHGSQFKDAALIVASPPCQAYSYRAMPWKRAKALPPPDNSLFDACFRIQREACEAAGRHVPMVVENVRGAQKWVGRAKWHYGSFYLWGDVPALMPFAKVKAKVPGLDWSKHGEPGYAEGPGRCFRDSAHKNNGGSWFNIPGPGGIVAGQNPDGRKTSGHVNKRDGHTHTRHLTNQAESDAVKAGGDWSDKDGRSPMRRTYSGTSARKAASAMIAKIPERLARHIARTYYPDSIERVG